MSLPVYLIDDEEVIRRSLRLMLRLAGFDVTAFDSGPAFLAAVDALAPGCVLLDVRMPEMDGLEVQQEMIRRGLSMPVILMTGHGDIAVAVSALKAGAEDFVEKPFERATILEALERAQLRLRDDAAYGRAVAESARRLDVLSSIERDVLAAFAEGLSNQAAAVALDIDVAAVEVARAGLIEKMGAASLVDVIRMAHLARRAAGAPD